MLYFAGTVSYSMRDYTDIWNVSCIDTFHSGVKLVLFELNSFLFLLSEHSKSHVALKVITGLKNIFMLVGIAYRCSFIKVQPRVNHFTNTYARYLYVGKKR